MGPALAGQEQAILITMLDKLTQRRGAAVLLEVLRSEGVRYIFGNPGTTELPLMDALVTLTRWRICQLAHANDRATSFASNIQVGRIL